MSSARRRTEVIMYRFFRLLVPVVGLSSGVLTANSSFTQDHAKSAIVLNGIPSAAFLALQKRAGQGYVDAELKLAADYSTGQDVEVDQAAATYWYRRAAESGVPSAQVEVGFRYGTGLGIPRDDAAAARWYLRASAEGDIGGLTNLGVCQIFGRGVPKNENEGFLTLSRAAKRHNSFAETYLGNLYYFGTGTTADPVRAENLYQKAAKEGNPVASYNLGTLLSVTPNHVHDLKQAATYLRRAVIGGYSPAQHSLGLILVNHPEIRQASGEAVADLRSSAEQGNWRSAAALGAMARDGQLQPVNLEIAYFWFQVAMDFGGSEAEHVLAATWPAVTKQIQADRLKQLKEDASQWAEAHPETETLRVGNVHRNRYFPSSIVSFPIESSNTMKP
jgi:TPR repeat protein